MPPAAFPARLLAALIALLAVIGIVLEFSAGVQRGLGPVTALWQLAGYFTILTNFAVNIVFGVIALGPTARWRPSPSLVAGLALSMLLVGIVVALLLNGLRELAGATLVADRLLHIVNPILVPLWWLAFEHKGAVRPRDPFWWAAWPLAYFAYAMVRGGLTGFYAYPFIDLGTLGLPAVLVNAVAIAAIFLASGFGVKALDGWLARRWSE